MAVVLEVFTILFAGAAVATNLYIGGGEADFSMLCLLVGLAWCLANSLQREVRVLWERFGGSVLFRVLLLW